MSHNGYLLIEDDPDQVLLLKSLLETLGHPVTAVSNAKDALSELSKKTFSAIVSDIRMPDMNGYDLVLVLRGLDSLNSKIPIVLVSAAEEFSLHPVEDSNVTVLPKSRFKELLTLLP
ncbi:MAG: response regulator [Bdellovibrionales bacterium]|nr:response regulator [Bdellovibrionales bacterium]